MWWRRALDLLYAYETLVVGMLAFCGVVLALWGNSYIARRERNLKILNDKKSLKVMLLEELRALKRSMDFRSDDLATTSTPNYLLSNDPLTDLFRSSLDKLGLLPAEVLSKVLPAYLSANHLPKNLRLHQLQGAPVELSAHFIVIPKSNFLHVRNMHRDLAKNVGEAITALESWTPKAP